MDTDTAAALFEALSSGIRLEIYRLLVRQGPEGLVAGAIAATLELPPPNLSFHLKALTRTGLIGVVQEGRFQRYRANLPLMVELIGYLSDDCCGGRPERCAGLPAPLACGAVSQAEGGAAPAKVTA